MKNHDFWYPTSIFEIKKWLSENGFDSPWTDSKSIFCPKEFAPIVTYLCENGTKLLKISHWYCRLHFLIKFLPFKADSSNFLCNFRNFFLFVDVSSSSLPFVAWAHYSKKECLKIRLFSFGITYDRPQA